MAKNEGLRFDYQNCWKEYGEFMITPGLKVAHASSFGATYNCISLQFLWFCVAIEW